MSIHRENEPAPFRLWLTVDEAAEHLGISRQALYRFRRTHNLPAYTLGNRLRFDRAELDEWLRQRPASEPGTDEVRP